MGDLGIMAVVITAATTYLMAINHQASMLVLGPVGCCFVDCIKVRCG